MLNVKKLFTKILETLVAQTSGSWRYVIIGGLFIGACNEQLTFAINTANGNNYQSAVQTVSAYPVTFTSITYSNCVVVTSTYSVWTAMNTSSTNDTKFVALSNLSRSSTTYRVKTIVIGYV